MPNKTVYDATFTPEVEAVLKQQIKWLKARCLSHKRACFGLWDTYNPILLNECLAIKVAFEKQLKRLRHEARERSQPATTEPERSNP